MSTQQTPTPAPDPRREQAGRLRAIAKQKQAMVETWYDLADYKAVAWHRQAVEALLAGAAALEALEVAKAALKPFGAGVVIECIENEDFSIMRERIVDWHGPSDFRAATAALARLEAL